MSALLQQREEEIEELLRANDVANRELSDIRSSLAWRVAHRYNRLRRHSAFVGKIHGLAGRIVGRNLAVKPTSSQRLDLTWGEFRRSVLAKRDRHKGVFVQECTIDWNVPLYQRPQHIATALGRLGYLVIYKTYAGAGDCIDGYREVVPNVWLTNRLEPDHIPRAVRSVYSTAYAYTPRMMKSRPQDGAVVYEYIDHIDPQISGEAKNIRNLNALKEWAFSGGADYVVASASKLADEARDAVGPERVLLVPNGVDPAHYRREPVSSKLPEKLQAFRKRYESIVGYFGAIAPWLWYELMDKLSATRPELGFLYIGPDYHGGVKSLPTRENVLYLGPVDYKVLPAYAKCFDVCMIPFRPGEIAKTTSPLKLFEYFAMEKPVVVTSDMSECVAFPEVFSGNSPQSFSAALDRALAVKNDPKYRRAVAKLADENDWMSRARVMEAAFREFND